MKKIINQHGDLIFEECPEIPENAHRVEIKKGYVLERGEGVHTHTLEDVEGVEVFENGQDIFIRVTKNARIDHEEHGIQNLVPGKIYRKSIERVWDYETQEARMTLD